MRELILAILLLPNCAASQQQSQAQPDPALFQEWRHSYEEDTDDLQIYRPKSFTFPLGQGRTGMRIEENGDFLLYDIAPNDMPVKIAGRWELISENKLEISFPNAEKESYVIEFVEISSDFLKVKMK